MMWLRLHREQYGKLILIGASVSIWLLILVLFKIYGYEETWRLWNIPTAMPPFLDFRLIPGSAESFARGYEPSIKNPGDPNDRLFNYPYFWRLFFYTGITQEDTIWISISMIVLFFIGVFLFPGKLSIPSSIGMLLVLFSPASMLLYERGNVDLIVFFICAMIVLAESYSAYVTAGMIMFGSITKMFPFFGISVLLRETRNRFMLLSAICSLVLLIYMIVTFDSISASWNLTPRGNVFSYGTNVIVVRYARSISPIISQWLTSSQVDLLLNYGSLTAALLFLSTVILAAVRNPELPEIHSERNMAAFRMGASIYVGTFLLGNNWDYRLAFLVFVVPQIVEWIRSASKIYCVSSWLSLVLIFLSCWHIWISEIPIMPIVDSSAHSMRFWFLLDETFNWLLFGSLAYLLFASAPKWLKKLPGELLKRDSPSQ